MRLVRVPLLASALCGACPVFAADNLKFGAAPTWVVPQPISAAPAGKADRPAIILLHDQQTLLSPGKISTHAAMAIRIQSAEGLAAGNLLIAWNPATEEVTVNRLEIRRGKQVIDVLASGQTFTTMRRETNLEAAMLDGVLTATIQPESLQVGDVIVLATTTDRSDPLMKGHVEAVFAPWSAELGLAHARLSWPSNLPLKVRTSGDLPRGTELSRSGTTSYELTMRAVEPLIPPKGAPFRYSIGRLGEATDFKSWADAADLMAPLYQNAAVIPAAGPLRAEVNKIRIEATDPIARAEQALALVQDRIRYVGLFMGQGGYLPASAETTWARRFGDCKAKTALLLALLRELDIEAVPVLANLNAGDAIGDRLPAIGLFNHVFVRARIAGRDYWLDGTRTGDTKLSAIQVPDLGWVLPVVPEAKLVHLVPPPLENPNAELRLDVDASKGVFATAAANAQQVFRGDAAVALQLGLSRLSEAQRQEYFRAFWGKLFDFITVKSATSTFDKAKNSATLVMTGEAKLDWRDGYLNVPNVSLGYNPSFERAAGPLRDAPLAVDHPSFAATVTKLRLPAQFLGTRKFAPQDVHKTLAGVEYRRTARRDADTITFETLERSLVPELPYQQAVTAASQIRALWDEDVYLPMPRQYQPTAADIAALSADNPASAKAFMDRGLLFLNAGEFDRAIADFTAVLKQHPKDEWALANRAVTYAWKENVAATEADAAAAEKINPNNPVVLRARALLAEKKSDYKAAVQAYTASLAAEPNNDWTRQRRALARRSAGDDEGALSDAADALKGNPALVDLRVLRANIFINRGDQAAVAKEADLLLRDNATSNYALVAAARIYARVGRKADALKAFDAALAIKPEPYIYLNRAQSRPFTDYAGRLADLEAALKLNPKDPEALAQKAEQLAVTGDLPGALKLYNQVREVAPDDKRFALGRAIILYKNGSRQEAERVLAARAAQAATPSDYNSLCWAKATAGIMLESAREDCSKALKLKPDFAAAMDSLALVELRLGKVDEAIRLYTDAIAQNIGSGSYMGRAIAYARKGDRPRSDSDRAEALRLDPDAETRFLEYGLKR